MTTFTRGRSIFWLCSHGPLNSYASKFSYGQGVNGTPKRTNFPPGFRVIVSSYIGNGNDPGGTRESTISDCARYQKEPQMSVPNAVDTLVKKTEVFRL